MVRIDLDFDKSVCYLTAEGKVEREHHDVFLDGCRKGFSREWIAVINLTKADLDYSYDSFRHFTDKSILLHQTHPTRGVIIVADKDYIYGQMRVFETLRDLEKTVENNFTFVLCRTVEEAEEKIAEIRQSDLSTS